MKNIFLLLSVILLVGCSAPIAKEVKYPSIVEIISNDSIISTKEALDICSKNNLSEASIYQWRNHLIVYDTIISVDKLREELKAVYSNAEIKYYNTPFYIFSRDNCDNKETASEWSHTIMTANLVADTVMQKEYMDYHATQTEKWPEIANGFCNANFQQLLIFRNGRQLMLIISIPKGENLDELNPKTTENNPRVDEWNAIMGKYQEGIPGTQPEESWVRLSPISK